MDGLTWFVLLSGEMKAKLLVSVGPGQTTQAGTGNVHLTQSHSHSASLTVRYSAGSRGD